VLTPSIPTHPPAPYRSENVMFIFLVHPFDVGDTLLLDHVRHDVSAVVPCCGRAAIACCSLFCLCGMLARQAWPLIPAWPVGLGLPGRGMMAVNGLREGPQRLAAGQLLMPMPTTSPPPSPLAAARLSV
jgi:hypothetical protein